MADEEPIGFQEGTWYHVRVKPGAVLRESRTKRTPYVDVKLEVVTGPLFGDILPGEIYLPDVQILMTQSRAGKLKGRQ